jgi:hypothetical protein
MNLTPKRKVEKFFYIPCCGRRTYDLFVSIRKKDMVFNYPVSVPEITKKINNDTMRLTNESSQSPTKLLKENPFGLSRPQK